VGYGKRTTSRVLGGRLTRDIGFLIGDLGSHIVNPASALAAHPEPATAACPAIGDLVLVARCDSVTQRDAWAELGPVAAKRELVGLLRVVALLGSRVLLMHAHVLDGVVLLEMGPYELARELGVGPTDLPIKVSAFNGSLRVALASMSVKDGFVWSSQLAFTDRIAAAQRQDSAARDAAGGDDKHSVARTRIPQRAATLEDIERHLLDLREQWVSSGQTASVSIDFAGLGQCAVLGLGRPRNRHHSADEQGSRQGQHADCDTEVGQQDGQQEGRDH